MNITLAQYGLAPSGEKEFIMAVIDEVELGVPIQVGNRHYDEIMRQVNAGTLTIADAD
tara:strand:+ start:437 stop:610 length:174 start_codon:yes stop_codon:yes gene_type:complete